MRDRAALELRLADAVGELGGLDVVVAKAMPIPWAEPEGISHAVVYLASDESRYVTGQQLRVDAGAGMKIGL